MLPGANDRREGFIRDVFDALNTAAIRYVVPRNWERLPASAGADIDVLVPAPELAQAVALIRGAAVRNGFASTVKRTDGQGVSVQAGYWTFEAGRMKGAFVDLDLRTYLSFELTSRSIPGLTYKVFAERTERCITQTFCPLQILSPVDEWIALYFQYHAKRRRGAHLRANAYAERLTALFENSSVKSWICETNKGTDPQWLLRRALSFEPDSAFSRAILRRRWGRLSILGWVGGQLRALAIRLKLKRRPLGPLVYFSGPDGAGKTTVTRGVMGALTDCGVRYKTFYSLKILLRAITKRLAFLKRIGVRQIDQDTAVPDLLFMTEDTRDRDTGARLWRLRRCVALLVGVVDIWLGWLWVLPRRLRGDVVLIETSPYDVFVKYHMPEFPALEKRLAPLLPRPAIGFLLEADPQAIFARRSELTVEEITGYYDRFARILKRAGTPGSYISLCTDTDVEATVAQAATAVLAATH